MFWNHSNRSFLSNKFQFWWIVQNFMRGSSVENSTMAALSVGHVLIRKKKKIWKKTNPRCWPWRLVWRSGNKTKFYQLLKSTRTNVSATTFWGLFYPLVVSQGVPSPINGMKVLTSYRAGGRCCRIDAQFAFLPITWSIFDGFSKFFFLLKAGLNCLFSKKLMRHCASCVPSSAGPELCRWIMY